MVFNCFSHCNFYFVIFYIYCMTTEKMNNSTSTSRSTRKNHTEGFFHIQYQGSELKISQRQYIREKNRKRMRQARLNQTQEQHKATNRQKRSRWNTHAHTADNVTVGQVIDARRRQKENKKNCIWKNSSNILCWL